jgi:hypothetical protein
MTVWPPGSDPVVNGYEASIESYFDAGQVAVDDAAGHEGGLEELDASLHDVLGLRVEGPQPLHRGHNVSVNAPPPSVRRLPRPIPDSLSQISRRGTRPS